MKFRPPVIASDTAAPICGIICGVGGNDMPVAMMMNEVQNYPVDERVAFADAVLQTLNPVDVAVQEKWLRVAEGRRCEIMSGAVRPIPTSEVLSEAYARAMA